MKFLNLASIFLLLNLTFPLLSSELTEEEKFLQNLNSDSGKNESIRNLKLKKMNAHLPLLSSILRNKNTSKDTIIEIINLYESYGNELEEYHPGAIEDYEWVVNNLSDEFLVSQIVNIFRIRKDKRLIYPVISLITHRNLDVRLAAFNYLETFKDDRALPYILELGNSEVSINRYYYLEALNYISDERATIHVLKLLNDPSPALRMEAIAVVDKLNLKDKQQLVLKMARKDNNYEVRKSATVFARNSNQRFRTDIFQGGIDDDHPEVRKEALKSIITFKDARYASNVSKMMEKESESQLRSLAIDALIAMNNHGGGGGLSVALLNDSDSQVRKKSAFAAAKLSAKTVLPSLLTSLEKEPTVYVRLEVTKSLGILKEKKAVPGFLKILSSPQEDRNLRTEVLASLDQINDPSVMPVVFDLIDEEQSEFKNEMKSFLRDMLYKFHGKK
ncbi:MAG: HEAT repeat domain-containing protein [Leptospiraceae bacterium]|nr:HEAT repeat domain-containing protein [Leptospiraceae bacterium]MCP5512156.1 HEAT repeat domain-containing protein [Leptospiraceae bacterium]